MILESHSTNQLPRRAVSRSPAKSLLLLTVVAAGCGGTQTSASSAAAQKFAQQSQRIAELEQQCIEEATRNTNAELEHIARTPDSLTQLRNQAAIATGQGEIARCKTEAEHLNEQISLQKRAEYQRQGEEERQRSSLMSILTTSRTH